MTYEWISPHLKYGHPLGQLVHDGPGRGHARADHHRRVPVVGLRQGELEQVGVGLVPVQDGHPEECVLLALLVSDIDVVKVETRTFLGIFITL